MSKQPNKKGTTMAEKQEIAVREKKELHRQGGEDDPGPSLRSIRRHL
jgi:hypothetical protein